MVVVRASGRNEPRRWIHVSNPDQREIERLIRDEGVPREFFRHALDVDEVARIDRGKNGTRLVVLRVPLHGPEKLDCPYRSTSLAVVLMKRRVITLGREESDVIDVLRDLEDLDVDHPARFVFQLANCVAERFLHYLHEIDQQVDRLEDALKASQKNKEVLALLHLQKALVHFNTALASNRIMLEHLHEDPQLDLGRGDVELLEEARVEMRQADEIAQISSNLLSNTMDAFASIISNNLNMVMKVMAAMTIILTFPMIISSFFGMNVALPGEHHPRAFAFVIAATLAVTGVVALVFRRMKWL